MRRCGAHRHTGASTHLDGLVGKHLPEGWLQHVHDRHDTACPSLSARTTTELKKIKIEMRPSSAPRPLMENVLSPKGGVFFFSRFPCEMENYLGPPPTCEHVPPRRYHEAFPSLSPTQPANDAWCAMRRRSRAQHRVGACSPKPHASRLFIPGPAGTLRKAYPGINTNRKRNTLISTMICPTGRVQKMKVGHTAQGKK